ncbi:uncharacterized protein [Montipora capricornis]|uniref:uncharacterized protein n=1 Tax=Montipora capricornis TaxID=246305 RepID=UPI0035F1016C
MVEWILINNYGLSDLVHYLDDFITVGPPDSSSCQQNLATALTVCKQLGLPLHPKKCEGPASSLDILGIHLNSIDQTAQLPQEKLTALRQLLDQWSGRRTCNRNQLESLIGHLHHAAKVVWPGRAFIRRMIDLLSCFRSRNHPIRLNREFQLDLEWWKKFLNSWHGVSFWLFPGLTPCPDVEVFSDAAGSVGFGAFCGREWFNGRWLACQSDLSIAYKELFPVVIAADLFGHRWCKKHVLCHGLSNSDSRVSIAEPNRSALELQCLKFLQDGLSIATQKSYNSAQRRFVNFCYQLGKIHASGSPCPAEEWTLCLFATFLANSMRHSSIKVYLSAVRALHIEQGFGDPLTNCLRLQRVLRGIKRKQGESQRQRLPITDNLMLVIKRSLNLNTVDHCMFWAACTLAYFGFLRSSEFTVSSLSAFNPSCHLQVKDVSVDSAVAPMCLRLCIKASKTDPFRRGTFIHIGRGKPPLCAVDALLQYLNLRGDSPGPLFLLQSGQPLTRSLLTSWLRQIMDNAGIQGNFSSHSFRIGAATVAARNGVPDHQIQTLGRWSSNAYQLYIRTPSEVLASLSLQLA